MFMEERHQQIAEINQNSGKITVAEIVSTYGISDESARRDLRLLEQQGICQRTHGGAIAARQVNLRPPADRDFETMPIYDNYRGIALAAVSMIRENDTVYITSGSFGHIMTALLPNDIRFTVVTNSVDMGKALRRFDNIDVYIAGGKMRQSGSMVDSFATAFVSSLHFDSCFLTGGGLTAAFGLSNGTDETASFQRTVIGNSRRRYLLMPGTKVGQDAFVKVCPVEAFHHVITDGDCAAEQVAAMEEKGVTVTVIEAST